MNRDTIPSTYRIIGVLADKSRVVVFSRLTRKQADLVQRLLRGTYRQVVVEPDDSSDVVPELTA